MNLEEIKNQCIADTLVWFPNNSQVMQLPFLSLAICGEAGELANLVKKVERGTYTFSEVREAVEEEVIDVFTYLMNLAGILGMDIEEAYNAKRSANQNRFDKHTG